MSNVKKVLFLSFLFTIVKFACFAQNTVTSGNWTDPTVWSTGVVPGGTTTVNVVNPLILDQNITITTGTYSFFGNVTDLPGGTAYTLTAITAGGTLDIKAGTTTFEGAASLNNCSLFVRNGSTLIIGALTLGNISTITIEAGGTLIINGDFTNNNNGAGVFTVAGALQVNGNYSAPVGSVDIAGSGTFFTTGTITTNGSSTVFGSTNNCAAGPCSGNNLCSFSNSITAAQTLCSGSTPVALAGNAVASPIYNWESSTASSTSGFSLASGTNNAQNYSPGALTQTTWYRRKATSGGCTGISVPLQMTISASAGGWIGTTSNWNTASNWCSNAVPTSTTDVSISTGVPIMPQMTAASNCRDLIINSGASVTVNASNTFSLFGSLTNNGTFTTNTSTITLAGAIQQTIGGSNPVTFNNLTINNTSVTSPQILLANFATVGGILTMTAGNVNLSSYNITIGTSGASPGALSYSAGWFYNGDITRWVASPVIPDGNVRGLFPLGTATDIRPFYVSFPAVVPTTSGTIRVGHIGATTTSTVAIADTGGPIVREQDSFWLIATNTLAGGTYNLRGEGTGFGTVGNVADLRLALAASVVGTAGTNAGTVTDPQVFRTGLILANLNNSFYIGSVNAVNSPLPITLTDFYGMPVKGGVNLQWKTESEKDFDYFQLERSIDGLEFQAIAKEKGAGTTTTPRHYSYVDANPQNKNYYRLRIIDLDGSSSFSKVIVVNAGERPTGVFVYPNPIVNKKFTVEFIDSDPSEAHIVLIDLLGRNCWSETLKSSLQEMELPASITPGIYFLQTFKGFDVRTIKVIIN